MFQAIINTLYRKPRSQWNIWKRFGGYFEYKKMLAGEKEMRQAAKNLVVSKEKNGLPILQVCFLTGKKFWHQTVFCAYSLQKVTPNNIHFTFYDDGTLSEITTIKTQVPNSTCVFINEIEGKVKAVLPESQFPYLNHKREVYKHIRKLTDVHAGSTGWKLILDSDMLFKNKPTEIIEWLKNPHQPIYMQDIKNAYGFPKPYMEDLANTPVPDLINVGCIGLKSESIDWQKIEYWAKSLEEKYGNSYYLEQALSAMIIGNTTSIVLAKDEYIVYPNLEKSSPKAKLLHYVDLSKAGYFTKEWRGF
ncbi:hypothetical protein [Parasediminibacterium sp. JCM 36343]|uniref:hypothetical protein n=1 Tax=Parasediminibacterium sp. JCM 36343 TaxID=3374279 RepID=UPI00397E3434